MLNPFRSSHFNSVHVHRSIHPTICSDRWC